MKPGQIAAWVAPDGLPVGPAARRLFGVATPQDVPGWDRLASGRSFHLTADWLRFADTDGVANSQYLGLAVGGRLVAALSSHWAPRREDHQDDRPAGGCRLAG